MIFDVISSKVCDIVGDDIEEKRNVVKVILFNIVCNFSLKFWVKEEWEER